MFSSTLRSILLVLALLYTGAPLFTAEAQPSPLAVDVAYLSSDYLEGRMSGSEGEARAAAYIVSRFEALGLTPAGSDGTWTQDFSFQPSTNPHSTASAGPRLEATNVLGLLDHGAEATVIVGAHYDHLGYGGQGSMTPGTQAIHNGADDNASGVAGMLEIAQQLVEAGPLPYNVLFIGFSGEEQGLYGSKYFVSNPTVQRSSLRYMINLDMIGRLNEEQTLAVYGTGTSPAWSAALEPAATATGLKLAQSASGLGPSDHASFYLDDMPVLHLFTGQHTEYHKPTDDSHLVNYAGIQRVADFAVRVMQTVKLGDMTFTPTQDRQQQSMAFKVGLGVMPDYVYEGPGLRLDAVLADRPGEAAGLKRGDVVVAMGDRDVTDVYSYMEALGSFEPGDTTTIAVLRDGERLEMTLSF